MTRTGQDAINYARSRSGGTMPDSGLCLQFVRTCFDVASYYYSAIDAWNGSTARHPGDRNPPPAVPVYFNSSSPYEHVAFYVGPGEVISTYNADIRTYGGISACESVFGPYLGWAEDINRVTVYDGSMSPDNPEDDFMSYLSYDEQRRMLQSSDTWLSWAGSIKNNNDRLPTIHSNTDLTLASTGNITNGVLELLDALHALQDALESKPTADRFSWRGALALGVGVILALAWAVGFLIAVVRPEEVTDDTENLLKVVGGIILGAVSVWLTGDHSVPWRIPRSKTHHMHEPPEPPDVHEPRDPSGDPHLDLRMWPQDLDARPARGEHPAPPTDTPAGPDPERGTT